MHLLPKTVIINHIRSCVWSQVDKNLQRNHRPGHVCPARASSQQLGHSERAELQGTALCRSDKPLPPGASKTQRPTNSLTNKSVTAKAENRENALTAIPKLHICCNFEVHQDDLNIN